ncbi:MAG TPA: SGNH/GDSL hydrolase family protein [Gammaproteobacteria bacterium]|jgi:lysophospholipase L1-like esterase|nr:SGNH/GDSL hydrolase family protein [Gammaproteobacteria bacterium]
MGTRTFLLGALLALPLAAGAQNAGWVGSWGASPLPPSAATPRFPATPSFANQTIRQIVRLSAGGDRLRLRLTNEFGKEPLRIGAARVALADGTGKLVAGTERTVTFGGKGGTTIPAGAPLVSDPVDLRVADLASLSVSLYFPDDTGQCTCHQVGLQEAYVSAAGDFTTGVFAPAQTLAQRAFLSGVEVQSSRAKAVVVLGDSISDGVGSTAGANHRWPDLLAERLNARGGHWGVVNHGISGNRVLADGAGPSALARLDRDVLSVPGAAYVIVFEGVNDLGRALGPPLPGFGPPPAAGGRPAPLVDPVFGSDLLIDGYRQIIARAHEHGLKVFGATIAPYEGAAYYSADGNKVREAVNDWIRKSGEFDAVLDFDAALRDPAKPTQIKEGWHAGDHLHGSDAGYRVVADSIDLKLFR